MFVRITMLYFPILTSTYRSSTYFAHGASANGLPPTSRRPYKDVQRHAASILTIAIVGKLVNVFLTLLKNLYYVRLRCSNSLPLMEMIIPPAIVSIFKLDRHEGVGSHTDSQLYQNYGHKRSFGPSHLQCE